MKDGIVEKILYDFLKEHKEIRAILVSVRTAAAIQEINIFATDAIEEEQKRIEKVADIIINDKAISISLEKGDVNQYILLAEKLGKKFPSRHVVLYLSSSNPERLGRIVFDSWAHLIHSESDAKLDVSPNNYPRMIKPYGSHNNKEGG